MDCRCYGSWLLLLSMLAPAWAADGPIPAQDATRHFTLPPGFQATLFAGEPDIVQPIAFTFDDRGRLWVVENHSYPGWKSEKKDRVLIFEDRDGDGRFDVRKVFLENGSNLSGIECGFGGVWLCSTPNLVFVPDANLDDVPDGEPVVKLDGWDLNAVHNVSSSLAWGPDGWLYGCNGGWSNSKVGKPGTPDAQRIAINCGVWRYHPTRDVFEVVAHGTTNPWGIDFDEYGQAFITNCVIQHLWHAVPGAHFQGAGGQAFDPHWYALMSSCADHVHWAGGPWQEGRGGQQHDSHGGGHAHAGAMVYLGDNWPDEYRNHIFMCNLHGYRVNQDILQRQGSGYVANHGRDFLHAGDPWFRGIAIKYGPDGGVYVSDWTDTGECHNYEVVDRSNGRIYKITYGQTKPWKTDLVKLSDGELVGLQRHENEWVVRHARRILQERTAAGPPGTVGSEPLIAMLRDEATGAAQLRALWALHAVGAANESLLLELMDNDHDVVRGWAVQLELEDRQASPKILAKLQSLAKDDPSSWVRLSLAAGLQRLPLIDRWAIAEGLVAHSDDAEDVNLSLMIWYGIEPLVPSDIERAINLAQRAKIPLIRQYIARRVAAPAQGAELGALVRWLAAGDDSLRESALTGVHEALQGRFRVSAPEGWSKLYPQLAKSKIATIRERGRLLALIFGDPQALAQLRAIAANPQADTDARGQAIVALTQAKAPGLAPFLQSLLAEPSVRVMALRGLAVYNDDATPGAILKQYANFDLVARQEAISTLAARSRYALALLDAVEQRAIPRGDLSAFHVQQLQNLGDARVNSRLAKSWGAARPNSADRAALIARYKQRLTPAILAQADRSHGRAIFTKTCSACHTLFDTGGKIGPELTGSQRANLDYVLSNVLDPSAVVAKDFQMALIQTTDGRVLSGIIKDEDDNSATVQTATDLVVVPKDEIETRQATANSMMPDGLLLSLSDSDVRDLVAYLGSPSQVPLRPAEAESSFRKAIEIQEALVRENPTVGDYQNALGWNYTQLAVAQRTTQRPAEAVVSCQQAIKILEKLVRESPAVGRYRDNLGWSYANLGLAQLGSGRAGDAAASHARAIEIRERLARDNPTGSKYQDDLAASHVDVGLLRRDMGKPAEAETAFRKAIEIREKLVRDNPTVADYQDGLAWCYEDLVGAQYEIGRPTIAEASCRKAIEIREKLVHDNPDVDDYRHRLAVSYRDLGNLQRAAGRLAETPASYRRAIEIRQKLVQAYPSNTAFQSNLANDLALCGDALAMLGKWSESADLYAQAVGASNYSWQTMGLLALVQLAAGNEAGYRATCADLAKRHAGNAAPGAVFSIALVLVVGDQALNDMKQVSALATRAADAAPSNPLATIVVGAAQYRTGRGKQAIATLTKALSQLDTAVPSAALKPDQILVGRLLGRTILALAYHEQAGGEALQKQLETLRKMTEKTETPPRQNQGGLPPWAVGFAVEIAKRELAKLSPPAEKIK